MLNQYVPFPRYENAVFIGDTAVSILSAMRIYAKALIGGELPNMERYYPQEKLLECTACFMNDLRVLTCAISHGDIDYILLEDNGKEKLNPAHRAEELKALGYEVRVLRVSDPINSLKEAGDLFNEPQRAQRVIRDYEKSLESLAERIQSTVPKKALLILTIRNPITFDLYRFALSNQSEMAKTLLTDLNISPVAPDGQSFIEGLVEINDPTFIEKLDFDFIALLGDVEGGLLFLQQENRSITKQIFSLPYYANPLEVKKPEVTYLWLEALDHLHQK